MTEPNHSTKETADQETDLVIHSAAGDSLGAPDQAFPAPNGETPNGETPYADEPDASADSDPDPAPSGKSAEPAASSETSPGSAAEAPYEPAAAGLPSEARDAARELAELREELSKLRAELQERGRPERLAGECEEFRALYPDVPLSALPDEVWESVRQGTPVAAAYALAERRRLCTLRQAEETNRKNQLRSAGAVGREKPSYFTPEEVKAMTPEEVRENYRCILSSMQKWR